jgi:hypothetical protein
MAIDLTNNPNCYVYYLARLTPTVKEMFYDSEYSFLKMLDTVKAAVLNANDTPARRRFLEYLDTECFNKHDVQVLCYNAVNRGKTYRG